MASTFEGMSITFSHLMRRPMTIQYPDKIPVPIQETLPLRYRGILEVDLDICTGCLACERDCPITCITIGIEMDKETKQRQFTTSISMFASACIAACAPRLVRPAPSATPQEFEGASYNPAGLVRHFAPQPANLYKPKKGGETEPKLITKVDIGQNIWMSSLRRMEGAAEKSS